MLYFLRVFFSTFPTLARYIIKLCLKAWKKKGISTLSKVEIELLCQEHGQENDDPSSELMEVLYARTNT